MVLFKAPATCCTCGGKTWYCWVIRRVGDVGTVFVIDSDHGGACVGLMLVSVPFQ